MSILSIRVLPDPILRQKAKRIVNIDGAVQRLIDDMVETMRAASGVGLAAPQVGVPLRLAVIEVPGEEVIVLINPEFVKKYGERLVEEACLSIPGYQGELKRSIWVKIKAQDRSGKVVRIKGEGLLAQAIEHELDHLNGVLYIDRIEQPDKLWRVVRKTAESEN